MAPQTPEQLAESLGGSQVDFSSMAEQMGGRQTLPLTSMAGQAVMNLPGSIYNLGAGLATAVMNPIDTATTVLDLGAGILQTVLPEGLVENVNQLESYLMGDDENARRARRVASEVGKYYVDRYGDVESVKMAIAQDPAGVLADISSVFSLGSTAPGRVGTMSQRAATLTEPLTQTTRAVAKSLELAGGAAIPAVIGTMTGTGGEPLRTAYRAGMEGGEQARQVREQLTGTGDINAPLQIAKRNLQNLFNLRSRQYREGMKNVSADPTVLSFEDIDSAFNSALNRVMFEGQIKDQIGFDALNKADQIVQQWRALDPEVYHTPEGLDALKQKIYDEVISPIDPQRNPNARAVVQSLYDATKKSITDQAPSYGRVMENYWQMSELIKEIETALSLNNRASADTAMRKLQSLMRDNVQTNYGQRQQLADVLEAAGEPMRPSLAGQALQNVVPRGIQSATGPLAVGSLGFQGNIPGAITYGLLSSPRVMGEAFYRMGQASRPASQAAQVMSQYADPRILNVLYQAGNQVGQ